MSENELEPEALAVIITQALHAIEATEERATALAEADGRGDVKGQTKAAYGAITTAHKHFEMLAKIVPVELPQEAGSK